MPSFQERSIHAHRAHLIELREPLDPSGLDPAGYQRRWIDRSVRREAGRAPVVTAMFTAPGGADEIIPRASVVLFWGDSGGLAVRLASGIAVAAITCLGGRVIAS